MKGEVTTMNTVRDGYNRPTDESAPDLSQAEMDAREWIFETNKEDGCVTVTTTMTIKLCLFCRAAVETKKYAALQEWNVYCSCGARGPTATTEIGAIALWNVRCKETTDAD